MSDGDVVLALLITAAVMLAFGGAIIAWLFNYSQKHRVDFSQGAGNEGSKDSEH